MTAYVFVDTETTSLDRRTSRPWEIGMIRREEDGTESTMELIVSDIDLTDADPRSLAMNGFYDRHPTYRNQPFAVQKPRFAEEYTVQVMTEAVAARVVQWMTRDAHLVGANVRFDEDVLWRMLQRYGLPERWHHRTFDVEAVTAGYNGAVVGGLKDCARAMDVAYDEAAGHSAMHDALVAKGIWDSVIQA